MLNELQSPTLWPPQALVSTLASTCKLAEVFPEIAMATYDN